MKFVITLFLLLPIIATAQTTKTLSNRALDQDLKICVNDGGVEKCPVEIDGATGKFKGVDGLADASSPGLVSTGAQTIAGDKIFTGTVKSKQVLSGDSITADVNAAGLFRPSIASTDGYIGLQDGSTGTTGGARLYFNRFTITGGVLTNIVDFGDRQSGEGFWGMCDASAGIQGLTKFYWSCSTNTSCASLVEEKVNSASTATTISSTGVLAITTANSSWNEVCIYLTVLGRLPTDADVVWQNGL